MKPLGHKIVYLQQDDPLLLQSGEAFTIEIRNLFYKGELNSYGFTEKDPTETNIRLQIQKLFDIFKNRANTERQKTKIDRFFANVKSKGICWT